MESNRRVSALECHSGDLAASAAVAAAGSTPGSEKVFHCGQENGIEPPGEATWRIWAGCGAGSYLLGGPAHNGRCISTLFQSVHCSRDGTAIVDAATEKDHAGLKGSDTVLL